MPDEIILDMGEYGSILVEPIRRTQEAPVEELGIVPASRAGDAAKAVGQQIKVRAEEALKLPLTGLCRCFMAALPKPVDSDDWQLDTFSVEFGLGFESRVGAELGAVAIVASRGGFKCTYTWTRKQMETGTEAPTDLRTPT